jgi:hypothetical protein
MPSGPGSLHFWKYECTVRHLGNPSGSMRHWQPLLSRYSTALKTSYKSTVRGLVRFRTPSSNGRTLSNCSRLTSLGYCLLRLILHTYRPCHPIAYTHLGDRYQKIVNRLLGPKACPIPVQGKAP